MSPAATRPQRRSLAGAPQAVPLMTRVPARTSYRLRRKILASEFRAHFLLMIRSKESRRNQGFVGHHVGLLAKGGNPSQDHVSTALECRASQITSRFQSVYERTAARETVSAVTAFGGRARADDRVASAARARTHARTRARHRPGPPPTKTASGARLASGTRHSHASAPSSRTQLWLVPARLVDLP